MRRVDHCPQRCPTYQHPKTCSPQSVQAPPRTEWKMNMKHNQSGNEDGKAVTTLIEQEHELSEASLAAQEFESLVKSHAKPQPKIPRGQNYEVHPCKRVRGYILRLPVIGWTLWHPTAAAALTYAERLAGIYPAECRIYDAEGSLHTRRTIAAPPSVAAAN